MNENRSRKESTVTILFFGAFLLLFLFLIWKCRYGYGDMDEAFYLTIPYRLCRGDGLFIHEWHVSQLSGLLLYPIVRVYLWITGGNTEGMILHFRRIFTAVWSAGALFCFFRLRKFSLTGAGCAALALLIYTPFGIMALSYNSMGILLLVCAAVIMATAEKRLRVQYACAGALLAGAVLCCPYLAVLYGLFLIVSLGLFFVKKDKAALQRWIWGTVGAAAVFGLFVLAVFSRCSFEAFRDSLFMILDDPEHPAFSLWGSVRIYLQAVLESAPGAGIVIAVCVLLTAAGRIWKKGKPFCFFGVCGAVAYYLLTFEISYRYINYLMFPAGLLGLYCGVTTEQKKIRKIFWWVWIPGAFYTFLLHLSSNQEFYAIASAAAVCTVASLAMVCRYVKEIGGETDSRTIRAAALLAAAVVIGVQLVSETEMRYQSVFWEPSMEALTETIDEGPDKGLKASAGKKAKYDRLLENLQVIKEDEEVQSVLLMSSSTMGYLYLQRDIGAYSAWLGFINNELIVPEGLDKLQVYYGLNPKKLPDRVWADTLQEEFIEYFTEMGYVFDPDTRIMAYCGEEEDAEPGEL